MQASPSTRKLDCQRYHRISPADVEKKSYINQDGCEQSDNHAELWHMWQEKIDQTLQGAGFLREMLQKKDIQSANAMHLMFMSLFCVHIFM